MGLDKTGGVWIGLDIGSVSVKGAIVDSSGSVLSHSYRRSYGEPIPATVKTISELLGKAEGSRVMNIGVTGSAGELVASLVGGEFANEIVSFSRAVSSLYPNIRTLIEMGGEDSKMLMFKEVEGKTVLADFSMNNLCAAGTGSFLDQQAKRIGVDIEGEFGQLALKSKNPPRIAGRCSVFAKSDMIHLQQIGTPVWDIVAGLCHAVARSYKSNVCMGREINKPVAFFGGVSWNQGVVQAMAEQFELPAEELFIPPERAVMGAIGAALISMENQNGFRFKGTGGLENYRAVRNAARSSMSPLTGEMNDEMYDTHTNRLNGHKNIGCFIGVDIGSLSTNVVAIDESMRVIARRYIRTRSRPIEAVTRGLMEIGSEIGDKVNVLGVGTTGSGRYMIGDFIGADTVRNEITAQATAAIHFHPEVDTIFEIGGQDSKYVSIDKGAVVDFEMNKVCAAGTGSFIEEQAEKIDLDIEKDFANTAFDAKAPGKFGDRCTVFIESDLVSNQQKGMNKQDLAAGLAYSIVSNYLNKVVGDRKIGSNILFQGGVAWNRAVVAAFQNVTGKKITVPPHHDVTGAIGAALIAMKKRLRDGPSEPSRFLGFDLQNRKYKVTTFECKACDNVCNVSRIKFEGEDAHYYGARCELFEGDKKKKKKADRPVDLFVEREKMMFGSVSTKVKRPSGTRAAVGVPRSLMSYELFPFWKTLLEDLGFEVVLSGKTSPAVIRDSIQHVKAETCFPIKIMHGHVIDLIEKGVDFIFLPSVITMNSVKSMFVQSYTCPLVQSISHIIQSAIDLAGAGVDLLAPSIFFQRGDQDVARELKTVLGDKFGIPLKDIRRAVAKARKAQDAFYMSMRDRGREVLRQAQDRGEKPVVILSRPYNGCDSGINLDLPRKLREMGKIAVPIDFLDLAEGPAWDKYPDMYWRSGQRIISAAQQVGKNNRLDAIFIYSFKCGPDSFIEHILTQALGGKPCLRLEIDEHAADAGAITRLEAFFDSLENCETASVVVRNILGKTGVNGAGSGGYNGNGVGAGVVRGDIVKGRCRTLYLPYMCDHGHIIAAALRGTGVPAVLLPKSDRESLDIGLKFSSGKECVPFAITTGDIIKKARETGFDPDRSAFFMPTTQGPCRFGQYQRVQRIILDELGFGNVPLLSPDADSGYGNSVDFGMRFRRSAWRGVVVVDILAKLLHETRPHELRPGETDRVYEQCLQKTAELVEKDSSLLFDYVWEIQDRFQAIQVDGKTRPRIGVVGEIFMRSHSFGNQEIIKRIENLGGKVWLAPIGEWIMYCTDRYINKSRIDKKYLDLIKGYMQDRIQKKDERKLLEPFKETLASAEDPMIGQVLEYASPYMRDTIEGEAILSLGKAVDFARKGLDGVVNIMPFSCMPGTIVAAISKKLREDHDNIPWLNLDYDGVEETNSQTRLEAFMYQAEQYRGKERVFENY